MNIMIEIKGDVGEIIGYQANMTKQAEMISDRTTRLETRVSDVESRQHWYAGAGSIIGMIAGWFGAGHIKI